MSEIRPGVCSGSKCVMDLKVTCLVELTQPQKTSLGAALRNGVGRSRNYTTSGGQVTVSLKNASAQTFPASSATSKNFPVYRDFYCSIVSNSKKLESTTIRRQPLNKLW